MLDPRQMMLGSFLFEPSAAALFRPPAQLEGGGKISFRISDLLHSPEEANSSKEDLESQLRSSPAPESSGDEVTTPNGNKKARKARTIFTDKQLQELETTFEKQKYLSVQDRIELAQRMGLSDTQVKTWYQNRRTKWKRQASAGADLLDAGNWNAMQHLLRSNPYWASYFANSSTSFAHPLANGMPLVMSLLPTPFPVIAPTITPPTSKD